MIFSGYMRGYGNTIIIDHGLRHYTVTARLDQLLQGEGEDVQAGEKIGVSGGIANLFGKGLYFEIREASRAMDPWNGSIKRL